MNEYDKNREKQNLVVTSLSLHCTLAKEGVVNTFSAESDALTVLIDLVAVTPGKHGLLSLM